MTGRDHPSRREAVDRCGWEPRTRAVALAVVPAVARAVALSAVPAVVRAVALSAVPAVVRAVALSVVLAVAPAVASDGLLAEPAVSDSAGARTAHVSSPLEELDSRLQQRSAALDRDLDAWLEAAESRRARIEAIWNDRVESGAKVYVGYSPSSQERVIVQFEEGWLEAQAVVAPGASDDAALRERLGAALSDALGWRASLGSGDSIAVLAGQVADLGPSQRTLTEPARAAEDLLGTRSVQWETIRSGEHPSRRASVRVPLVGDHLSLRALRFRPIVERFALRFALDPDLVAAIIEVESAYNPRAESSARALGLMQVVPESGGRDAHGLCDDLPTLLTRQHYFDPEVNIQLGCAYLHILMHRIFAGVHDPHSRLLLTLAAYNGGPGTVATALTATRSTQAAVAHVNQIDREQVRRTLRARLPARETREYVDKVLAIYGEGTGS